MIHDYCVVFLRERERVFEISYIYEIWFVEFFLPISICVMLLEIFVEFSTFEVGDGRDDLTLCFSWFTCFPIHVQIGIYLIYCAKKTITNNCIHNSRNTLNSESHSISKNCKLKSLWRIWIVFGWRHPCELVCCSSLRFLAQLHAFFSNQHFSLSSHSLGIEGWVNSLFSWIESTQVRWDN